MTRRILSSVLFGLLLAVAAGAGTFTVTLTNGTTFESRYRPIEAEWDDRIALINTDRGNSIALLKDDIADVTSSIEESGFGYQVNSTTIFLGLSYDEAPPEEDGEGAGAGQQAFPEPPPSFNLQQFVNPGDTGASALPVYSGYGPGAAGQ